MKILNRILLATDFEKSSAGLLENAIRFAKRFKTKILLIHILPKGLINEKAKALLEKAALAELEKIRSKIEADGVETLEPVLEYGRYSDRIVQTADKFGVNAIFVGSGGKGDVDNCRLGTTTDSILRKSDKPVIVIKNNVSVKVSKIICPVDFSLESERALYNAIIFSRRFDAELLVISVAETSFTNSLIESRELDELKEALIKENDILFDKFLSKFNFIDVKWEKETAVGCPSDEIVAAIKKQKSDLLFMGTTGKSGLSEFIMGSVTVKVTREVPCSFVTLKSEDIIDLKLGSNIKDIETHFGNAKQLISDGFFEEAINEFKTCLHISQMHIPSLNGIAQIYEKIGKEKKAEKYRNIAKEMMTRIWDTKIENDIRKHYKR
ncbi:MAG: universal stress protein [Flavobacteriales bacterium]|nr:universal stress protein [Flavobacteriales bacterium]